MAKAEDAYKEWFEKEFLPSVSEDKRDAVKAALLENEVAKNSFLRQADYTKKTTELSKERQQLEASARDTAARLQKWNDWWANAKPTLEAQQQKAKQADELARKAAAYEAQLREYGLLEDHPTQTPGTPRSRPVSDDYASELEALKRQVGAIDTGALNYSTTMANLAYRAAKDGFDFDANTILEYSRQNGVSPVQAYEAITYPARQALWEKQYNEEIEKAKEEGKREVLSKMPLPDRLRAPEPGSLDLLAAAPDLGDRNTRMSEALKAFTEAGETS